MDTVYNHLHILAAQFPGNPAEPHFPRLPNYNIRQRQHGDHQHELERGEQPQLQWQQPRWQPRHPQSPDQQPEQPQPQEEQQQQHQQQQHEYNFEPDSFHRLRRFQAYPITNHTFQASNIRPRYNNIHTTRIPISSRMIDRVKRRETIQAPRQDHYLQIRNICVATFVIFLIYIALLYFEVTK
ncbi:GATA zinc finger domain-containing protein 10-like isoform X2 [Monodelphis domestica]|uniref:GATA zinc finger domain-containing protein 10-like isoform X2 n=1 Tax=Monodelphis domestica TaxID=13616 RepID=UPI0024E200DA|nr:GATA zinc finger domain-containing protein 10-like isoform X2 [Monodelphis domestica]